MSTYVAVNFFAKYPNKMDWGLLRFDSQMSSPLNGSTQTIRRGYRWKCALSWNKLDAAQAQTLEAWLTQMSSKSNMCLIRDFTYQAQGSLSGAPTFTQKNTVLNITLGGFTASAIGVLKAGDFLQFSTYQLVRVMDISVDADATGAVTINIEPELRATPSVASVVTVIDPSCYMQMSTQGYSGSKEPPRRTSLQVDFIEVIP